MSTGTHDRIDASEMVGLLEDPERIAALRHHLDELTLGLAFRGSHRSQQFLRHVVEKTLQGSVDELKERTIGIELFQRPPSYDTGEDAIVRVTASDVRRRLLQHYGRYGDQSHFRIQLPPGSYVPWIEFEPTPVAVAPVIPAIPLPELPLPAVTHEDIQPPRPAARQKLRPAFLLPTALFVLLLIVGLWWSFRVSSSPASAISLPPWTAIFRSGHATHLITSDPNIEQLEELTGSDISLSDYANQKYVPNVDALSADQRQFYNFYLHADNPAAVDTPLAVNIARLVPDSFTIDVGSARSLRVRDTQTDDNFILLGSPRSDPWFQIFESQLDFRFAYSKDLNQEIIRNVHPLHGEPSLYVPTAGGFATGESFAILALVQIPNQSGQALLLAGADGEGTEAVGHLVTDRQHLLSALQFCGISPRGPAPDFELLLHLHTMAGSPSTVDLAACHRLPGYKPS
ncbi:MAG: hypothetical protein WBE38_10985 [Terracidiphilus sp.]